MPLHDGQITQGQVHPVNGAHGLAASLYHPPGFIAIMEGWYKDGKNETSEASGRTDADQLHVQREAVLCVWIFNTGIEREGTQEASGT